MHWYKKNIGDYYKKAGRLSVIQHGAYTLLMDACYDREQFPTREQAIEWVWASSDEEIAAVDFVLSRFFVNEDGVFVQHRIKEELSIYNDKAEKNRQIALEREAKRRESKTNKHESCSSRGHVVNETPPNQEPVTSNQELELKDKDVSHSVELTPHQQILDLYHELLPQMAKVKLFSDARKRLLRSFWKKRTAEYKRSGKEYSLDNMRVYLAYIADNCQWMMEDRPNGKGGYWKAKNFDFVFTDKCYIAVKEERFNDLRNDYE
jgi:uncharacterized protein YdaU (DUF1376 family)